MRSPGRAARHVTWVSLLLAAVVLAGGSASAGAPVASAPGAPSTATTSAQDRRAEIVRTLVDEEVYLEPSLAGGDAATWAPRLREAAGTVQVPGGVAVAGWVGVPGSTPDPDAQEDDVMDGYVAAGGDASLVATSAGSSFLVLPTPRAARPAVYDRLDEAYTRSLAVGTEAVRRFSADRGLGERPPGRVGVEEVSLHPAAALWLELRLLAPDAPSQGALVSQVAADPTFFVDTTKYVLYPGFPRGVRDDPTRRTSSLVLLAAVVGAYLAIRAARALRDARRRREAEHGAGDAQVVASPAEVEEALTRLAEELARAPVRLDDLGYRRAQRCRDAAERYVDRDAERDRVGVLLLCRDGSTWLAGGEPAPRCYFHPGHRTDDGLVTVGATTAAAGTPTVVAVDDLDAQVPCCRRCAAHVADGVQPDALRVAGEVGAVEEGRRAYHEVDDSWTRTGYGSVSDEWAQQVLDESWTPPRRAGP